MSFSSFFCHCSVFCCNNDWRVFNPGAINPVSKIVFAVTCVFRSQCQTEDLRKISGPHLHPTPHLAVMKPRWIFIRRVRQCQIRFTALSALSLMDGHTHTHARTHKQTHIWLLKHQGENSGSSAAFCATGLAAKWNQRYRRPFTHPFYWPAGLVDCDIKAETSKNQPGTDLWSSLCGFGSFWLWLWKVLNGADHTNWRQGHQGRKKQHWGKL